MAIVSKEQNVFLTQRADMPSVEIPTDVFPVKGSVKQLLRGLSCVEIENEDGHKAKGVHGSKSLLMWRAAVEGLLERAALFYTRDSDSFHTQELQGGNAQQTDFNGCYIELDSVITEERNDILGAEHKRRWRYTRLFQVFLYGVYEHLFKRTLGFFGGREMYEWIILPPILTTTEEAQDLIRQDITNDDRMITAEVAAIELGDALQNFPCGGTFYAGYIDTDALLTAIQRMGIPPDCGMARLDGEYESVDAYLLERKLYDKFGGNYFKLRRRIGALLACGLNTMDLARIGLWLAHPYYYASGQEHPRQSFVHKSVTRNVSIEVEWSGGEDDFSISITDDSATESTAETGRYAKYVYDEGDALVEGNGFASQYLYTVEATLGAVLRYYFFNPDEWEWVSAFFALVETRIIRDGTYSGEEGTFVWIRGSRMAAFMQAVQDHGFSFADRWNNSGSCSMTKPFGGVWTSEASGSAYFADIDYPCEWAIDNGYIGDSGQEWMFGIGKCVVDFNGEGEPVVIYDAFKATSGGAVKDNRTTGAAEITAKYLADIWKGIGKITDYRLLGSLQAMKNWMNGFGFAPDSSSSYYDSASIQEELIAARDAAEIQYEPCYCLVGVNDGDNRFQGFAGFYTADIAGAPDSGMRWVESAEGFYAVGVKSFSLPVWCRDFDSSFVPYDNYSAQGEIESYIGAFNWAWKAIAHD